MVSNSTREKPKSTQAVAAPPRWRGSLLAVALVVGLVAVLGVGAFAIDSRVIYQRSSGEGCLWAYSPTTATDRPLLGTAKMANCIIGDLDGDGAEDEIVYRTGVPYTVGYYKIPSDGEYHAENDHLIGAVAEDCVPQTIVRDAATGWGTIIYNSPLDWTSFALSNSGNDTWQDMPIGQMDKAFAADMRHQGFKGDLFYQIGTPQPDPSTDYFQYFWREGAGGIDHAPDPALTHPNYLWQAYGVGRLIPNRPDSSLVFYTNIPDPTGGGNLFAVCDANWDFTVLGGVNGAWGPLYDRTWLHFGPVDDSGLDSIVFCNGLDLPLQSYRPGDAGPGELTYTGDPVPDPFPCDLCPWDATYYVNTDPEWPTGIPVRDGCIVKGIVTGVALAPRTVTPLEHISDIRALAAGDCVSLTGMVKTLDTVRLNPETQELEPTGFYIEEPSRVAGIRVDVDTDAIAEGSHVSLTGQIADVDGELTLLVDVSELTVTAPDTATFAIHPDGTDLTFLANTLDGSAMSDYWWQGENGAAAGDVMGTGVKNDLLYIAPNGDLMWREGISGPDHFVKAADPTTGPFWPLATGYVLPDKPANRIFAFNGNPPWDSGSTNAYAIDTSGDAAKIWEITAAWGSLDVTRMDASRVGGTDDVLFFNIALQWTRIAWDSANSRYIHDPAGYWVDTYTLFKPTLFGQHDAGCANGVHRARLVTQSGTKNCVAGKIGPTVDFGKLAHSKVVYYVPDAGKYAYGSYDSAGGIYQMDESERMSLPRYADIDGDGMDDIVYQDYDTGELCWYQMTSEWVDAGTTIPWHAENVHKIANYGIPLAVLEPAGSPRDIVYYDKVTVRPVGATAKAFYGPALNLNGMLVTVAGRVSDPDPYDGTFTISDGSPLPLTVSCPDPGLPTNLNGAFVTVTGCVGAETPGASTVPVIRVPSASYIH